jgi:hypothetical protein
MAPAATTTRVNMKKNLIYAVGLLAAFSGAGATSASAQLEGGISGLGDARAQNLPTSQGISNDSRAQGAAPVMSETQDPVATAQARKRKRHY